MLIITNYLKFFHLGRFSIASNPGFPFRILSCSFGEKGKIRDRKPGFRFFSKTARQNLERKAWI